MDFTVISIYTRAQAIEDGVLVDVTETAKEAGFTCPVAVTAALWADIQTLPRNSCQDVAGRLWDVLWMAHVAIKWANDDGSCLTYDLFMRVGRQHRYTVKLLAHPGDAGELVITLMQPGED